MAHIDLKKDAHIFTQAGVTIQNLLNVVQSFEANELEELRDLITAIKDINTTDDDQSFKQQLLNVFDNAVMEDEVTTKLDNTSTLPPQAKIVKSAIDDVLDRIKQTNSDLSDEIYNRQTGDQDITTLVENESLSRQNADDKINRELYGSTTNSYTLSSDIDPAQVDVTIQGGSGVLSVDIENLTNAFVLNGTKVVSEGKTIATYQIEYGEDISRLFAVVDYNVQLKTFDFKLVKSDDITSSVEGNIATLVLGLIEFGYGFNTSQGYFLNDVSKSFPYTYQNVSQNTVIKINGLADLQTIDKSSFISAINELARTDMKVNVSLNDIKKELNGMSKGGIWHYGEVLTHTANLSTPVINNSVDANVGDFYLNSNTFSVYFCVGDDNGNHNWLYIGNLTGSFDYSNYASINSPNFTGTPTAPTPSLSNNSRQVATTEYVRSAIDKYASGDNLEMIDLAEGLRDDVYGKQVVWTVGGNIMNLTLPAPKLTNPTTSEEVKITFDKGIIPFDNTVKRGYLPYNTTNVSFIPITENKTYINCEFNFDTQHLEFTTSNSIISQDTIDAIETRVWKFSLCYYTVNVVYNDSSEEPASQYVISNYDCDWCINSEKIALPYQTLDMLKTVDKNCIINSINEIVDNASKNQSEVGTLIYALHPDITTYSTSAAKDGYYGKLIKSDVDEVFILNNDRQDDMDYPDGATLSGKLPYDDEVGYMLSQDIPALKKAFCKVTKKYVASIDGANGEIEVLLTF
ncbi:MAG: hypothetical protein ACLVBD_06325 [Hominilimicola sp.]|uniref:hypothetical protein n=1 Tax=Hominilimicola sp. TaxID=3073571 RepID=UPI00399A1BD8